MRDLNTSMTAGLSRTIESETSEVYEGYREGEKTYGLQRQIMQDGSTLIQLFGEHDDTYTFFSSMHFDKNFTEFTDERKDDLELFGDLSPEDFRKTEDSTFAEYELLLN